MYRSYATSTGLSLGNEENTYDILLTDSTNTVEVPAKSSKTVYYQFSNTNKGTVKYHLGYTSDNVIAKVWWDTEDPISGTIEYGEYKFIKLKLINDTTSNDTITIKPVLGFKDGGDVIPDSNTTLVTGTINETNTMNIKPETALNSLGLAKASVKEISFVKDNIVPIGALGSSTVSEDDSVMLWYTASDSNGLYKVYIGSDNGITSFPVNSSSLFYEFSNLKLIYLDNIDTSNVVDMSRMFQYCGNLEKANLNNFDTSNTTTIRSLFAYCYKIANIDFSSFDTKNMSDIAGLVQRCFELTSIDLSNFDTSKVTDIRLLFCECPKLTSIDLSNFDTSNVTNMSSVFRGCTNLENVNLNNFDTSKVTIMSNMFRDCQKLVSLNLNSFDTQNVVDMNRMFYNCSSLISLNLSNFDTSLVTNMAEMFSYCELMENIDFGDNFSLISLVEDVEEESDDVQYGILNMFYKCNKMTDDTINGILKIFSTAGNGIRTKTLKNASISYSQATTATTLSNYQMFINAGWTTGY